MDQQALDFLKQLVSIPTPSGWEQDGMRLIAKYLKENQVEGARFDVHGNLIASLNEQAPTKVMIEGHCDEIGFMVVYIDDNGFLYLCADGGVTSQIIVGDRVVIQGRKGPVNGVFGVRPPHLMKPDERKKLAPSEVSEIAVDIGAKEYIHDLIWNLAAKEGKTIILISSDMNEMIALARRILIFKDKKIVDELKGEELFAKTGAEISAEIGKSFI